MLTNNSYNNRIPYSLLQEEASGEASSRRAFDHRSADVDSRVHCLSIGITNLDSDNYGSRR